jgi:hypothetical protein
MLQKIRIHGPELHDFLDLPAPLVIPDPADKKGMPAESLQVPGNIERRAPKYFAPIRKTVKQYFAEDQWPALVQNDPP